jgi:hypothetical protein
MMQITHIQKTLEDLFDLHKGLSEKLDVFQANHPEIEYNIQLFIGEKEHKIVIDISNANRTTIDDKETGPQI